LSWCDRNNVDYLVGISMHIPANVNAHSG